MKIDDYRQQFAAELKSAGQVTSAALALTPHRSVEDEIALFEDPSRPPEERMAALRKVQTATFLGLEFEPYKAIFRAALRKTAEDRSAGNEELRASALELLSFEKDETARQLLLKGFDDPKQALVPAAKALQLLGHDDHGDAIPIARKVIEGAGHDQETKEEAVRLLAADPASGDLLSSVLMDPNQPASLRSASAASLRVMDAEKFEDIAKKIALDDKEDDDVRASCLGALNHLQGYSTQADKSFNTELSNLDLTKSSDSLRAAAHSFLTRTKATF